MHRRLLASKFMAQLPRFQPNVMDRSSQWKVLQVDNALEAEVVQRATELLDVSVDVGKLGTTLTDAHHQLSSIKESVLAHKKELEWEGTTVTRLRRRKEHMQSLEQVCYNGPLNNCVPQNLGTSIACLRILSA